MKVLPDSPIPGAPAERKTTVTDSAPRSTTRPTVKLASAEVSAPPTNMAPPLGGQQSNVTFRRDLNGRMYYVVSDAQSGKEIQELPAAAVRSVGQEIDEYLKRQEAKATPHVNVKA